MVSRATRPAMRLAVMLLIQASTEQVSMMPPQSRMALTLRVGITRSMMVARHQGSSRSMMALRNLMPMPRLILPRWGFR